MVTWRRHRIYMVMTNDAQASQTDGQHVHTIEGDRGTV